MLAVATTISDDKELVQSSENHSRGRRQVGLLHHGQVEGQRVTGCQHLFRQTQAISKDLS